MQTVSQKWKDNQDKTLVNESFVEVSIDIADPDALVDATARDNGSVYISNTPQVVNEVNKTFTPYATLEQNLWVLDGSRQIIPKGNRGECGYVGNVLSGTNGSFDKEPVLSIDFSKVHNNLIPALTITWSETFGEYARDFTITAYNGNEVVATQKVTDNKDIKSIVYVDIEGYNRIEIVVHKWCLPYHRARIEDIFIGMSKKYSKKELFSFSHSQTADPISTELPKSDISFSIDNTDNSYNPQNEKGLSKYLIERQEIKTRYGYKMDDGSIEWIDGGIFYLSEWDAEQNGMKANFTARDLLEFMSGTFYKGIYNKEGTSLYDLALQVLQDADLPLNSDGSVKWVIDDSLKNIKTSAPLPIDTHANCLQLIANAGGCTLTQNRGGTLYIKPILTDTVEYDMTLYKSYAKPDIVLSKPLKEVDVSTYQYFDGNESELYKGTVTLSGQTELTITYSGMATDVVATVEGGTLVSAEYYTNACKLVVSAIGDVIITVNGTILEQSKVSVITSSSAKGETVTVDNPLIANRDRAEVIGKWVEDYLRNRMTISTSWRADPRLDVLDFIDVQGEFVTNNGVVTDVSYDYTGSFKGSAEIQVIVPREEPEIPSEQHITSIIQARMTSMSITDDYKEITCESTSASSGYLYFYMDDNTLYEPFANDSYNGGELKCSLASNGIRYAMTFDPNLYPIGTYTFKGGVRKITTGEVVQLFTITYTQTP